MDIAIINETLNAALNPVIILICIGVGFIIKPIKQIPNKFIPGIVAIFGIFLAIWSNGWTFNINILLTGMFSGFASCGLYDAVKHFLSGRKQQGRYEEEIIDEEIIEDSE